MSMYHGISDTEPSLIYTGTEGFRFSICKARLLGRGNYFAEIIVLADQYSYLLHDETFVKFSCLR